MLHVTEVIKDLSYNVLVYDGIIPDLKPYIDKKASGLKRYPHWVYKELKPLIGDQICSFFGYYMDYMVRKMISDKIDVNWNLEGVDNLDYTNFVDKNKKWNNVAYPALALTAKSYCFNKEIDIPIKEFSKNYGFLGAVNKYVQSIFSSDSKSNIEFNTEFYVKIDDNSGIQAHPDIIGRNMVIDIKNSQKFSTMAESSFLQILSYVAIMRRNGIKIKYTGILLPLQLSVIYVDISDWNSEPFLEELLNVVKEKQAPQSIDVFEARGAFEKVGTTLSRTIATQNNKKKTLSLPETLYMYSAGFGENEELKPIQIFFGGNRSFNYNISEKDFDDAKNFIKTKNINLYIHAPYIVNFSRPVTSKAPDDEEYVLRMSETFLETAQYIGCKGVVFHVGKAVKGMNVNDAIDKMETSIRRVIKYASEDCPFLLETPVGAGNEVLWKIQDFINFYNRFDSEEKQVLKICIDTCHVWCAGYEPLNYIKRFTKVHGVDSVKLIHYNDSRKLKGCRADGHAPYGFGNIGLIKMLNIAKWCNKNGLHMVTE